MKKTLIMYSVMMSVNSFAQQVVIIPPRSDVPSTYYEKVKNLFDQGTLPKVDELVGFNVGRCFMRSAQNSGRNFVMYGKLENTGVGPIDNDAIVAAPFSPDGKIGAFDKMTGNEIEKALNEQGMMNIEMLPVRTSQTSLLVENNASTLQTWEVRKKDAYLVYHIGSFAYCYTFINHESTEQVWKKI